MGFDYQRGKVNPSNSKEGRFQAFEAQHIDVVDGKKASTERGIYLLDTRTGVLYSLVQNSNGSYKQWWGETKQFYDPFDQWPEDNK